MVKTGIYYALALAASGWLVGSFTNAWAGAPFYILALFCLWFFRDPSRRVPAGAVAVSPADGKVIRVRTRPEGTEISIFLNIFDVHVNRSPIAGKVVAVEYKPGKFYVASKDAASLANEKNTLTVEGLFDGRAVRVTFSQVAGLIARRIVCYKKPGDFVTTGERIGLIQFGSRVDISLDPGWRIEVAEGERVSAGSSVLAVRQGKV